VLKRVLRVVRHLTAYDVTLLHFGALPDDPLVNAVAPSLHMHVLQDATPAAIAQFLREQAPPYVVFGEAPLSGALRVVYRVAESLGIRQACIDNYYGDFVLPAFQREWPRISRWLLLGLEDRRAAPDDIRFEIVPPLLDVPRNNGSHRDRVVILGYDADTLRSGVTLLGRLPMTLRADVHTVEPWLGRMRAWAASSGRDVRVSPLPTDEQLAESLAHAAFVVCKNGFQQMVESLFLGAPVIARVCGGGVDDELIAPQLRRWIRYVKDDQALGSVLFDAALWLAAPPAVPWRELGLRRGDESASAFAAARLAAQLQS